MIEKLLEALCEELSIFSKPEKSKDSFYTLVFAPDITVLMNDLNPGVGMSAKIIDTPQLKKEDLLIHLMRANLLGQGTGGCRIGLDQTEKILTLSLGLPYEMNYSTFRNKFEDFVNYVLYWREEIAKFEQQTSVLR